MGHRVDVDGFDSGSGGCGCIIIFILVAYAFYTIFLQ